MKTNQKIAILIPAYNEEKYVGRVIKNCLPYQLDIIVIDDGSKDQTVTVVKKLKQNKKNRLVLLRHSKNKGKGAALDTRFKHGIKKGYQGVITLDADAQHDTKEIEKFLQMVKKEKPDLIIGSRFQNTQGMPFSRLATNYVTSWIISKLAGQKVEDVQSGFRYISAKVIKNIELKTKNFETEPELILKACWLDYQVKNLPIATIYYDGFVSEVNKLTDTLKFFELVFKSLVWRRSFYNRKSAIFNKGFN